MDPSFLAAMAALGLASGVHCAGMCGGIVTAFSLGNRTPQNRGQNRGQSPISARLVLFNAGRISSYAIAGALAGSIGWYAGGPQTALLVLANVVLVFVGLHLAGLRSPMRWLESLGAPLWRRIQPFAVQLMKKPGLAASYGTGLLWGWLPCGLVYGALAAAAFAGSPAAGAGAMLAFGVGTLPWLLAAGVAAARLRGWLRMPIVRLGVGGTVLGFGAWGLAHAGTTFICS
jgi:uncharacterized protein